MSSDQHPANGHSLSVTVSLLYHPGYTFQTTIMPFPCPSMTPGNDSGGLWLSQNKDDSPLTRFHLRAKVHYDPGSINR